MSMIHDITSGAQRNKLPKRKGRGESSGFGKTSGRGTKGAKARGGTYIKRGYEGGQTPIFRRLPKRGFSNFDFERRFHIVNVEDLNGFADGAAVDPAALIEAGLVPDEKWPVKILGEGALTRKLTITASRYTRGAYDKIIAAGGAAQGSDGQPFAFPKPKPIFVPREPVKKSKKTEEPASPAAAAAPAVPAAPAAPEGPAPAQETPQPKA